MEEKKTSAATVIAAIAITVALLGLSLAIVAAMALGICWAFDLPWSWKISFGVWLAYMAAAALFMSGKRR